MVGRVGSLRGFQSSVRKGKKSQENPATNKKKKGVGGIALLVWPKMGWVNTTFCTHIMWYCAIVLMSGICYCWMGRSLSKDCSHKCNCFTGSPSIYIRTKTKIQTYLQMPDTSILFLASPREMRNLILLARCVECHIQPVILVAGKHIWQIIIWLK